MKKRLLITALCASALMLTGCAADTPAANPSPPTGGDGAAKPAEGSDLCALPTEMTSVSIATNPGVQDLIIKTLKEQEFDKKYNIDLDVKEFLNPPATATAITQKAVDVGFGGHTSMAIARQEGADVVFIGSLAVPINGIFVPADSEITSLDELGGKKLGSFSGTSSATSSLLGVLLDEAFDLSLQNIEFVVAPDAALAGLMGNGEVDAMLAGADASALFRLDDKYREIGNLSTDFKEAVGMNALYLGPVTTESYAADHCGEVTAYSNALLDTIDFVKEDDATWASYSKSTGHTEEGAAENFKDQYAPSFVTDWGPKEVDDMSNLIEVSLSVLGDEFNSTVPDGLFSLEYNRDAQK